MATCQCGRATEGRRKWCATCRKRASRRGVSTVGDQSRPTPSSSVAVSVRAELEAAGRLDSSLGQQALSLAARLDGDGTFDTGSALAAVSRELRSVMESALRDSTAVADPLDEFTARRERKAAGA